MKRTLGPIHFLLLISPLLAGAQETVRIKPGDRVKVTAQECGLDEATGLFLAIDENGISTLLAGASNQCPLQNLEKLEVSRGQREWWNASLIGMGVGVGVGAGLAGVTLTSSDPRDESSATDAVAQALGATAAGFLVGTLIGVVRDDERWEKIPLQRVRPGVKVHGDGRLTFGISVLGGG